MLEKIRFAAMPSLRATNWEIDAPNCQGCSSQFTFINRKHHCRRCEGIFCNICSQQRMILCGQGDFPVRVCEPCKILEEAARVDMRHGHNRIGKGSSKLTVKHKDEVISQNRGVDGKESSSSEPPSRNLSGDNFQKEISSANPEDLQQNALGEKKRYKSLKGEEKLEEAKDSGDLASELRDLGWTDTDLRDDGDGKAAGVSLVGELSSLIGEIPRKTSARGTDNNEVVSLKKKALMLKREGNLAEAKNELKRAKVLEKQLEEQELLAGSDESDDELSAMMRNMDNNKQGKMVIQQEENFDFDHLVGTTDDLDINGNVEVTEEDMEDPELATALESLGWTEDSSQPGIIVSQSAPVEREATEIEILRLKREALNQKRAGNVAEATAQLKKAKLLERDLENFAAKVGEENISTEEVIDPKPAAKSRLAIQKELLGLKKKARTLRREGRIDDADEELKKAQVLERQLEEMDIALKMKTKPVSNGGKNIDLADEHRNLSENLSEIEGEGVTDQDMNDPSYLSILSNLGWNEEDNESSITQECPKIPTKASRRTKAEIQRELLGLKRNALALRRQGNTDEAEVVMEKAKELEAEIEEMEAPKKSVESNSPKEKIVEFFITDTVDGGDTENVTGIEGETREDIAASNKQGCIRQEVLLHKSKAVALKREGKLAEAREELRLAKLLEKSLAEGEVSILAPIDAKERVASKLDVKKSSGRDRFKLQQESLGHKRQALKLRREGLLREAEAELELAKALEAQLEELTADASEAADDVVVEDFLDPQLFSALKAIGLDDGSLMSQAPAKNENISQERAQLEERIKAEKMKAVNFKRSGKQAEALEALRRAKLFEKKLNSLTP